MKKIIDPKRAARNLDQCLGKVRDYLDKNPVQQDIYAEYENLNAWMPVTCLYSLIEQSFKVLKDLRGNSDDNRSHNLSHLFCLLESDDKDFIRERYKEFQSLHNYIAIPDKSPSTVGEAMGDYEFDLHIKYKWKYKLIDGQNKNNGKSVDSVDEFLEQMGSDYTSWRYIPNEGSDGIKGKVSVYAMIEIVSAVIDILMRETMGPRQVRRQIEDRLWDKILGITRSFWGYDANDQEAKKLNQRICEDMYAWGGRYGNYLNAFSHLARYDNDWRMLVAYLELLGEFLFDGMERDREGGLICNDKGDVGDDINDDLDYEKKRERSADEREKICKVIDKIERITHRLSLPQCEDYKSLLVHIRQSLKTVRDRLTKESMISDGEFRGWHYQSMVFYNKIDNFHSTTHYESFFLSLGLSLHPMTMVCLKKRIHSILVNREICIVYGHNGKPNNQSDSLSKSQDLEVFLSRACTDELPLVWNDEKRIFENEEFVYAEA